MVSMRAWAACALVGLAACGGGARQEASVTGVDLSTALGARWAALGGEAVVGTPTADPVTLPNGDIAQEFEAGVMVTSTTYGPVFVTFAIYQKWLSLQAATTASGQDAFTYIGSPRSDAASLDGIERCDFARGMVMAAPAAGWAWAIYGTIYARYVDAAEFLGLPTADEAVAAGGGRRQSFQGGDIYSHPSFGAHAVSGDVRARWLDLGGPDGSLGYPTSEQAEVLRDGLAAGTAARFQRGTIFRSDATGAWEIGAGPILVAYEETYGGPGGWLGFPVGPSGETARGTEYADFEAGMLARRPVDPAPWAFQTLDLYWQRMEAHGSDCWAVCGNIDIYLRASLMTSGGSRSARIPDDGHCHGDCNIGQSWTLTPVARHDFTIHLTVRGYDADIGDDDSLGSLTVSHDVDDLFGILAGGDHSSSHDPYFVVNLGVRNFIPYEEGDWVSALGWSFRNFTTPTLSFTTFAETFRDVAVDESEWLNPVNSWFYDDVYKDVAAGGNCFGMALTSVYAQKDRLIWAEPIFRFPVSDALVHEVNVKHGYQLSAEYDAWYALNFGTLQVFNPVWIFETSRSAYESGEYPVLVVSTAVTGGTAHAVRPYRWVKSGAEWRIYIYDNNYPGEERFVSIDPSANTFSYEQYGGGMGSGGLIYQIPYWVLDETPRTAFWEVLNTIGEAPRLFRVGEDAVTEQITAPDGRTFYAPGLSGPPTRWDQIEADGQRVAGLARLPFIGGGSVGGELFVAGGEGRSYAFRVLPKPTAPASAPVEWAFTSPTLSAAFSVPATPGLPYVFTAKEIGAAGQGVSVQLPEDGAAKEVTLSVAGANKRRWAEVRGLRLVPGQEVGVALAGAGFDLVFTNDGPATRGELTVNAGTGGATVDAGTVVIPHGEVTVEVRNPVTEAALTGGEAGDAGWWVTAPTVTLNATDFSGKGIAFVEYRDPPPAWIRYLAPFVIAGEGEVELEYRAKDNDGNLEATRSTLVRIDTRDPAITARVDKDRYARTEPFVVHFDASDPAPGSGLSVVTAVLDGATVGDGQRIDLLWFGLGTHTLAVAARDRAGRTASGTVTFEVVATAASLGAEIDALRGAGAVDSDGVANSLKAKVDGLEELIQNGRTASALQRLRALEGEVRAQAGKHLTAGAAEILLADIASVRSSLR